VRGVARGSRHRRKRIGGLEGCLWHFRGTDLNLKGGDFRLTAVADTVAAASIVQNAVLLEFGACGSEKRHGTCSPICDALCRSKDFFTESGAENEYWWQV
jgi:hypothetical protein